MGAVEAGGVVRGRSEERAQQGTVGHRGEHVPAKFMYTQFDLKWLLDYLY